MGFFLAAVLSLAVLAVVLMTVDVNMTPTRRIEAQVARDTARIRRKTLQGWSAHRIAARYPKIAIEHVWRVRREMARNIAADQEIRLLQAIWSMPLVEREYER
jgi:hypothetical protein